MTKIAYFGGSFSPIHLGHLNSANYVLEHLKLDELYFMPNATPPHKAQVALSYQQRCELLQCSLHDYGQERFKLSYFEQDNTKTHYTYETLKELNKIHDHAELFFIIGMDSLINLNTWKNWDQLVDLANIVVLQRPGYDLSTLDQEIYDHLNNTHQSYLRQQHPYDFIVLSSPSYDISSTQLRKALQEGNHELLKRFLTVSTYQRIVL